MGVAECRRGISLVDADGALLGVEDARLPLLLEAPPPVNYPRLLLLPAHIPRGGHDPPNRSLRDSAYDTQSRCWRQPRMPAMPPQEALLSLSPTPPPGLPTPNQTKAWPCPSARGAAAHRHDGQQQVREKSPGSVVLDPCSPRNPAVSAGKRKREPSEPTHSGRWRRCAMRSAQLE